VLFNSSVINGDTLLVLMVRTGLKTCPILTSISENQSKLEINTLFWMRKINTLIAGPHMYIYRGPFILVRGKHIHTCCGWKFCSYYPDYIFEKNSKHLPIPNTILTPGFYKISCLCIERVGGGRGITCTEDFGCGMRHWQKPK
jgi:hypothetical protein